MPPATIDAIINQINALGPDELRRVENAVQERLKSVPATEQNAPEQAPEREKSEAEKQADFHHSLLAAGLITRFPVPRDPSKAERPRIKVLGEPVSETIIRERR